MQAGFTDPVEGFVALVRGGHSEMTVLAIIAGADLGCIVAHHLLRLLIVIAGAPLVARLLGVKKLET